MGPYEGQAIEQSLALFVVVKPDLCFEHEGTSEPPTV